MKYIDKIIIMNIFYLYKCAKRSARAYCDKHIVKMCLELAQILSTCYQILIDERDENIYKITHKNHPIVVWCRESEENFEWCIEHGIELCREYTKRYNKIHKSQKIIEYIRDNKNKLEFKSKKFKQPPKCMPDEYKISESSVECYREYYKKDKIKIATWKYSKKPIWIN